MNVLDSVNKMLKLEEEFGKAYSVVRANKYVVGARLAPELYQFRWFLEWLREGLVYVQRRLGDQALPGSLSFSGKPLKPDQSPDFVGYIPQYDQLAIGCLMVARFACVDSPNRLLKYEESDAYITTARGGVIIMAVHECYHAYQHKVLHTLPPEGTPGSNSLVEKGAKIFMYMAARELSIFGF